ncbi:MAG: hypothetical protein QXT25_02410 [Candidatus Anstonellaceae archaeon]
MTGSLKVAVPMAIAFGAFAWILVFAETYRHFPKMEKVKRIEYSAKQATFLVAFLVAAVLAALLILQL